MSVGTFQRLRKDVARCRKRLRRMEVRRDTFRLQVALEGHDVEYAMDLAVSIPLAIYQAEIHYLAARLRMK